MQAWQKAWREGFVPSMSTKALEALRDALSKDDSRLMQGATTNPPPLTICGDWPVTAACATGYCGWQGEELKTVEEVEEFFARVCMEADHRLGEPAGCRWFLNWFDETPREEMRQLLLAEVEQNLAERKGVAA